MHQSRSNEFQSFESRTDWSAECCCSESDALGRPHLLLRRFSLLHQLLLSRCHRRKDWLWATCITLFFHKLDLNFLLCQHAPRNNFSDAIHKVFNLFRHFHPDHLQDANRPLCETYGPQKTIITKRILSVKSGLDQESVSRNCASIAAKCFKPNAISILWFSQWTTWESSTTAHIRLTNDVKNLQALLSSHATATAISITEWQWSFAWRFE